MDSLDHLGMGGGVVRNILDQDLVKGSLENLCLVKQSWT
jgi:hypothetical protein